MSRLRPCVLAVAVSGPGEAAAAMLSPRGRSVRLAPLPFVTAPFRRQILDARALADIVAAWRPDVVATWADTTHYPPRGLAGYARSLGVVDGVLAASGLPVGRARPGSFRFAPEADTRRWATSYWPKARSTFSDGSRAFADAALLAEEVRDPGGYDDPRGD